MRGELEIPFQLSGIRIERNYGTRIEVVAWTLVIVEVRRRIPRAPVDQVQLGIIGAVIPGSGAGAFRSADPPGFRSRLSRPGSGPEAPQPLAGLRIVGVEKPADSSLAPGAADNHFVLDRKRWSCHGIAHGIVCDVHVPSNGAGLGVERNQV